MKLKLGVKIILGVLITAIIAVGGFVVYKFLYKEKDSVVLFQNALENVHLESQNNIDNQPIFDFEKYEMYGRMKQSFEGNDTSYNYKIALDVNNKYLDLEYDYLNEDNEVYYREYMYQRDTKSYILYPDIVSKVIDYKSLFEDPEEVDDFSSVIPLEEMVIATYMVYELECIKTTSLDFISNDNLVLEKTEDGYKTSYKMDKDEYNKFSTKYISCIEENEKYMEYISENVSEEEEDKEEVLSSEIIIYTDKNDNFVKLEQLSNDNVVATITKQNNSVKFEYVDEDNDTGILEIGDKIFALKSTFYSEGNIINLDYVINYDSVTKNRASGDMDMTIVTSNKNESSTIKILGNFSFNKKDVSLKEINKAYKYEELSNNEILDLHTYFNQDNTTNPST